MTDIVPIPRQERGAALLTVLLLVAVMAVVSATALERLTLATRIAASSNAMDQARQFQGAAEALAVRRIDTLLAQNADQTLLAGGWHGRPFTLPLPGGSADLVLTDGGNCFNLNSLVSDASAGAASQRPLAIEQFAALMRSVGVGAEEAARIAASSADWIDPDQMVAGAGAEDAAYASSDGAANAARRTADHPMADASEISAIAGVTPPIARRIAPWLCALPVADLSPINVNTLLPEQAPLLQMLVPGRGGGTPYQSTVLSPQQARAHLAARPIAGYGSVNAFWTGPTMAGITPGGDAAAQVQLKTRWFHLSTTIHLGDVVLTGEALIDADGTQPARVVRRRWGPEA